MRLHEGTAPFPSIDPSQMSYAEHEQIDRPPEQESDKVPYPDIPDIDRKLGERAASIFGSRVRSANRDTRLIAVVEAVSEVIPGSLPEDAPDLPATQSRRQIDSFFRSKVPLPGGVEMKREEVVNFGKIRVEVDKTLERANHPIFQAIRSLKNLNQARIASNEVNDQKVTVLSQAEVDETIDDVLKATQGPEITNITDTMIRKVGVLAVDGLEKAGREV